MSSGAQSARLPIRAAGHDERFAGWKPATQQVGNLRYAALQLASALLSKRLTLALVLVLTLSSSISARSADLKPLDLPAPQRASSVPLAEALQQRKTTREFKLEALSTQALADLLWAAFGINRPQTGQRTAPSAMNSQEVDIYVALQRGLFLYNAASNRLDPVLEGDFRPKTSSQAFAKQAPVVLIYVADLPRLSKAKPESRPFYAAVDTGAIVQNVYLHCAAAGLGTVVYDLDRPPLANAMKLRPEQSIVLCQAVGNPAPPKPPVQK